MKRMWRSVLAWAAMAGLPGAVMAAEPAKPIEVLVLGTFHLDNPGQDLNNARVDPVTTPDKQRQLAAIADGLARFCPTLVAVERVATDPVTLLDPKYPAFTPADLLTDADERVQIGYRLAHAMRLPRVYAVDEQSGPGVPDYFPYDKVQDWARAHGQTAALEALMAGGAAHSQWIERQQRTATLGAILREMNRPGSPQGDAEHGAIYYGLLPFSDATNPAGADLNTRWYARNVRAWAKLLQVAKPGDRVVLLYGAGHLYWLRHFASLTPGVKLIAAGDYLP